MSTAAISCTSARLEAIALVNGRARSETFLRVRGTKNVLHTDDINPASASHRDTFLGRLPDELRDESAGLLLDLAEAVAVHRAKPKAETQGSEDPFSAVEPWADEVQGVALLDEVRDVLDRFMVLPPHASDVIALWVAHTYVFRLADYTPYLLVTSPTRECGKSTLLDLLAVLAHRAQQTGGITAAALYRRIARLSPTMLLDELDTRLRGDGGELLRGVLNSGFQRNGKVTICTGDDHEEKDFATYSPKVLAGIGRVWDTVTSRSIPIRLARASKLELAKLQRIRGDRIAEAMLPLRRKLLRWTTDIQNDLRVTDSVTPTELGARQSDVWRPLLAIADVAGGHWPDSGRTAAIALHGVAEEEGDYGLLLLQDLRALFNEEDEDELSSAHIVEALTKREDRPWPEYKVGKPITPRGIASLLGRFGIRPKTLRIRGELAKGYELGAIKPVFEKYLEAAAPSVTAVTAEEGASQARAVTPVADNQSDGEEWL